MNNDYQRALDKKLEWLHWSKSSEAFGSTAGLPIEKVWPMYQYILSDSDTYFMNDKFCDLVETARASVPDDLEWQAEWVPTKRGFMWLEKPFQLPKLGAWATAIDRNLDDGLRISAVGWFEIPPGTQQSLKFGHKIDRITGVNEIQICFFLDFGRIGHNGFNPWSYCSFKPGDKAIDRIRLFESGAYVDDGAYTAVGRDADTLHEIRWAYSAFHLMSQRLAMQVEHQANRHARRRLEESRTSNSPAIQYITLRRYEEAKARAAVGSQVEWSCQWMVGGHWRNQWYASEQKHRKVWIEDYVKGPEGKPLRQPSEKIYRAVR